MKEKNTGGTPEKSVKSKSPDKPQAAIETVEKTGATEDSSEKKQSVKKEATANQGKWKGFVPLILKSGNLFAIRYLHIPIILCVFFLGGGGG